MIFALIVGACLAGALMGVGFAGAAIAFVERFMK